MTRGRLTIEVTYQSSATRLSPPNRVFAAADWEATWDGEVQAGTTRPELEIDDATRRYLKGTVNSAGNLTVTTKRLDPNATNHPSAVVGDVWVFVAGELEADKGKWPGRSVV